MLLSTFASCKIDTIENEVIFHMDTKKPAFLLKKISELELICH